MVIKYFFINDGDEGDQYDVQLGYFFAETVFLIYFFKYIMKVIRVINLKILCLDQLKDLLNFSNHQILDYLFEENSYMNSHKKARIK